MEIDGYDIRPLTPGRFADFETVLGKSGKSGCWCMYWIRPSSAEFSVGAKGGGRASNKAAFRKVVDEGPPPGLLAYDEGSPVAWCRVTPRAALPGIENSRYFKTRLATTDVWSLSCFVVGATHRGRGLTRILTQAAMEYAADQGAAVLESYPTDSDEQQSPAAMYLGKASTFRALGFEVVQTAAPHKPMMRIELSGIITQ